GTAAAGGESDPDHRPARTAAGGRPHTTHGRAHRRCPSGFGRRRDGRLGGASTEAARMRARTVTAPLPPPRTIVAAEITALVAIGVLAARGVSREWPTITAVGVIVAVLAAIRVHGRNLAGWLVWSLPGRRRRDRAASVAQGIDVRRGDQHYGVLR